VRFLGLLENLFTYNGAPGHELVLVFDATFAKPDCYARPSLALREEGWLGDATWVSPRELVERGIHLCPAGLASLIEHRG
jgi:hypothetical protein